MQRSWMKNQERNAKSLLVSVFVVVVLCISATSSKAQLPPSPEHGFQPAGSFALSNIETINTANGNMMLRIPLAALPSGRGNSPGFEVSLNYNSKLYDTHIEEIPDEGTGQIVQQIHLNPSEQGGWHYNVSPYSLQLINRIDIEGWTPCNLGQCGTAPLRNAYVYKLKIIFPDSGEHEFRPLGYVDNLGDGYYNINPNGLQWSTTCNLFLCEVNSNQATTAGMSYYSTDGSFMRLDIPYSPSGNWMANWTLSFPDGRKLVTTNGVQRTYDRNNNYTEIQSITYNGHPARKIIDQLGRSIIIEFDAAAARDYIYLTGTNDESLTWTVKWKTIYAYKAYRATASGTQHGNLYPQTGSNIPSVVDQIILPAQAGSLTYTFAYNAPDTDPYPNYSFGWGEISSITVPSGAQAAYAWTFDGSTDPGPVVTNVLQAAVTRKDLTYAAEYDGASTPITDTWTYSAPMNYGTSMTITGPDGGITRNYSTNSGPFARQSYKTENPDGSMIERVWQQNIPYQNPPMNSGVNPFIKTEFTSIKNSLGSFVLTAIKDYRYDKNGNVTEVKEYDWVDYGSAHPSGGGPVIPAGLQPKRVTINTFFNSTPDASDTSYNANVYNQPGSVQSRNVSASTEVRDNAQPSSRTEFFYDNPSTSANLTQAKSWDSTKGVYSNPLTTGNSISGSTQYNIYGSPTLTTDAKGFQTQMTYEAIGGFSDLYPTRIKTAYNTSVQRTQVREYSFYTGSVKRVTDVDNNVSTSTDFDAFGRPTLVRAAEGKPEESRTTTEYSDALRRVIVRADLNTIGDGKLVTVQHYDQLGRVRLTRQLEDAASQSATDETTGIKVQTRYIFSGSASYVLTSNPYRAATSGGASGEGTMGWTRTKTDNGGRVVEVQTFGGGSLPAPWNTNATSTGTVITTYDANFTTVSDQAGKVRRSQVDGLGRLARVDEPDGANNLGSTTAPVQPTNYSYDATDNLTTVTQGTQTRTFVYDSLKRLKSSMNPESGTVTYNYDSNSNLTQKTDARGIVSTYVYDALNRNTTIDYSDTSSINPDVSRFYDGATNGKGRLWYSYAGGTESTGSNVEKTLFNSYDALGRPLVLQQAFKLNGVWSPAYQMSRAYNRAGGATSQIYPSGRTVAYSYDSAGRIAGFTGNLGDGTVRTYSNNVTYSPFGGPTGEQFGTNIPLYQKSFYNTRGQLFDTRLSSVNDTWDWNRGRLILYYSSNHLWGQSGTDNNGNVRFAETWIPPENATLDQADVVMEDSYTYDSLNRLVSVSEQAMSASGGWVWQQQFQQTYSYDRYGNRTINAAQTSGTGINNKQFTVAANNNRLGVPAGQPGAMSYDAAGNLTTDTYTGAGNRTYDAENKMTAAQDTSGGWSYYTYNADGQRTRRKINNQETWQVYGFDGELIAEYTANGAAGSPQKEYGYRNGQLLVTAEPAATAPTNVALASNGATATASSAYTGFAASGAINGDRKGLFVWQDGYWSTASTGSAWLEVQFNGSKTISEIDVVTIQDNYNAPVEPTETMTFSQYGLTGFEVQYWTGSAWATISGNITGNNKVWRKFTFAPLGTTKIRVLANTSPDGFGRLTEVEAWTGPSPAPRYDLALGAAVTASSSWSSGWGPSAVVNGDRKSLNAGNGGAWVDAAPANTFPDWVQVDFGTNKTITEIDVFTLQDNYAGSAEPTESMTFTQWGLTGYQVQYWDGSNWITVPGGSVTGNNKIWRKFTFSPITTSKIRVLTNASVDGYSRLTEIEAYGPAESSSTGGVHWLVSDHLGTPRMVCDQTGSLANIKRHDYLPFGEELFAQQGLRSVPLGYAGGDGVRQQFTQKERDSETGLDFFEARYYASTQGRFTSADPFNVVLETQLAAEENPKKARAEFNAYLSQPQQWNRYSYAINNPLLYVDPTGEAVQLSNDPQERERQMQALREAVGAEAAQYLYVNQGTNADGSANYYVGIYDSNPSTGDSRSFEQVNEVAGEYGAIIRDPQVVTLELVGRGNVTDDFGTTVYIGRASSARVGSPAVTGMFNGQLTIKMLDWSKHDLGYLPGEVMSDNQDNMVTPSVMLGHEFGHARAWMTGYHDRRVIEPSTKGSLRLENKIRKLQFPNGPTRKSH